MDNIFVWVIVWVICAFIAGGISSSKGQSYINGFFIGLFLGVLGVIAVIIFMPNISQEQVRQLKTDEAHAKEIQQSRKSIPLQPNSASNFGTISVSRKSDKGGRLVKYNVIINDQKVGAVGYNEEVSFKIPSGECVVYIPLIGGKSNVIGINLEPNQTVRLNANYTFGGILLARE